MPPVETLTRRRLFTLAGRAAGFALACRAFGIAWAQAGTRAGGAALAEILRRAGVRPAARPAWFEAADHATLPQAPRFLRSLPLAVARGRSLVALRMNGAALPPLHGGPARIVTPGWYGMASTKWVTRLRLAAEPSDNQFMVKGYRYVPPGGDPLTSPPVESMRVKTALTRPLAG